MTTLIKESPTGRAHRFIEFVQRGALLLEFVCGLSLQCHAKDFFVNLRADAVYLEPATNSLGRISFVHRNGINYLFQIERTGGQLVQDQFFYDDPSYTYDQMFERVLSLSKVERDVEFSHRVGFGPFGVTGGTLRVKRAGGFSTGTYELTGTAIGTVSGRFRVVEFRGLLSESSGTYSGRLVQRNPFPGLPEQFVIGPASNDDVMGTDAGRNYNVGFSSGEFSASDPTTSVVKEWTRLRGTAIEVGTATGTVVELQASDRIGGQWQTFATFPAPADRAFEVFRLRIQRP